MGGLEKEAWHVFVGHPFMKKYDEHVIQCYNML